MQADTVVADRFRLVKMIGKGGMGSVWEAVDNRLATQCAIKFIEGELANVAEAQARFEREAKAAAQLRSSHVVQIFDHGVWQSVPYIAMELLRGRDLGKWLQVRPDGKLTLREVGHVVNQVCKALAKAHAGGFVHRDLKPDNIFLCNEDSSPALDYLVADSVVKILDFGVAKQTGQAIDGSNTKTGAMLGTPYYMSPEQAQGIKAVDGRSDLWSMAVIVYQCLTGRLPFESEALGDLLFKIFTHEATLPTQLNPELPPGIDNWWRKAASKQPEGRYQSAKEFSEALHQELGEMTQMEMSGRARAQKLGGGTALMQNVVPNTPNPYVNPAQTAAMMSTPNPVGNPQVGMWTPQGQQAPVHPPMMQTPAGAQPGAQPGTFSGMDAPPEPPKKGAALPILAGLAALAILGAAFGGYAVMHKNKGDGAAAAGSASATATASVATAETTTAPTASTAPTTPDPTATTTAAAESASAAPTHANANPPGGGGHRPPGGGGVAAATTKPPATAATTTKPAGTGTSGAVTPHGLGF